MCIKKTQQVILLLQANEIRVSRRGRSDCGRREGDQERKRERDRDREGKIFGLVATSLFHIERKAAARKTGVRVACFSPAQERP